MRALLLITTLWAGSSLASQGPKQPYAVSLSTLDFGRYQLLQTTDRKFTPSATAGFQSVVRTRVLQQSEQLLLEQGLVFGFNYRIVDDHAGTQWVPVVLHYRHPTMIDYTGASSTGFSKQGFARLQADGSYQNGAFYIFSKEWEMVPGEWEISVSYRGEHQLQQRFDIVLPDAAD
jgi:hypothetical protein